MAREAALTRSDFPQFLEITTRWMDMDPYGHLNIVVHDSLFDSTVNAWLIEKGALDIEKGEVIGLVVETGCHYFAPLTYPDPVIAALRVAHLGRSSVRYEIGLFAPKSDAAAAQGHFVHVYVDRASRRPVELPPRLRDALLPLLAPKEASR